MSSLTFAGSILRGCAVGGLRSPFHKTRGHRKTLPDRDLPLALGVALLQLGDVFSAANRAKPMLLRPTAVNLLSVIPYAFWILRQLNSNAGNIELKNFYDRCYKITSIVSYITTITTAVALVALGNYILGLTTLGILAFNYSGIKAEKCETLIQIISLCSLLYLQPINALLYIGFLAYPTLVAKHAIRSYNMRNSEFNVLDATKMQGRRGRRRK